MNDVTMHGRRIFISFVSRLTRENVAHLSGSGDRDPVLFHKSADILLPAMI
jgi:hypothetical protein